MYLLIVCWTWIVTPLWCRYRKLCRMNAHFLERYIFPSPSLALFLFCRCRLSIGSLVAYCSPVEGHSCFRDVNMTVILRAADSCNYLPVILAIWKLKIAFITDKMGCHVPLLFTHFIFSETSKKYLTQSYVTDCFTSSLAFLCYTISARSLMMSTIVTLLYCETFRVANVIQEFKSL